MISDLNGEKIAGSIYEEELPKTSQEKGNKLHVKRKGYDNSLKSWIDEKGLI